MVNPSHILSALCSLHSELYWVGGPVRDELMGRPCDDWDIVCRGARSIARRLAQKLKARLITLDEQNKIYRVIVTSGEAKLTLDFAEMQGRTIRQDLARRDFTLNAMARLFPQGQLIDPYGGLRDIHRKRVRAVSEKAFVDDPLRLLRAYRFAAQFGFAMEPKTRRWLQEHRSGIGRVAAERIRQELLKLLTQPGAGQHFRAMDRSGLLRVLFPEIESCRRSAVRYYGRGGVLKHSLQALENLEWIIPRAASKEPMRAYVNTRIGGYSRLAWLKLAVFLHDLGKPATAQVIKGRLRFFEHEHKGAELVTKIGQRLRCSRQETLMLAKWVRHHMRVGNLAAAAHITDKAVSRFFRDLGEDGVGMVLVSLADHYTYLPKARWGKGKDPVEKMGTRLLKAYYEQRPQILPAKVVNGHDLMRHLKIKPSPVVGKLLEAIQDAQSEGKVRTKEDALAFARRKMKV